MIRASLNHLEDNVESYFEHMRAALRIACLMFRAGIACATHAIVPALCTTTASRCLAELENLFASRRAGRSDDQTLHRAEGRLLES